jgi:hypothetical protein
MTITSLEEYTKIFTQSTSLEVKAHGEVYTPLKLVTEMLDKLPPHVWSDPNLKWFEPACGLAPFLYMSYQRLMAGLADIIPDVVVRRRHILEQMFFFNEIQPKNITLVKLLFNSSCYKLNLFEGDAFKLVPVDFQADIIAGNPPYNDGSGNKGKGHTLWTKFVEQSLTKWLAPNGYLLFVTPSLWRQHGHQLQTVMKSKQILYLKIHGEKDGQQTFKCNTRYDCYLIKNVAYTEPTFIVTERGENEVVDLRTRSFIPNHSYSLIAQLVAGEDDEKLNVLYSRSAYGADKKWVSKIRDDKHQHPCIYTINKANTPAFRWSSVNDRGHFGVPKVMFGGGVGYLIDAEGKYGMTQWVKAIIAPVADLEAIKTVLESSKFNEINKAIAVSKAELNYEILRCFRADFWRVVPTLEMSEVVDSVGGDNDKCQAMTGSGRQCSRKGGVGGKCRQHSGCSPIGASSARASPASSSRSGGKTVAELRNEATAKNVKGRSKMNKAELLVVLGYQQ